MVEGEKEQSMIEALSGVKGCLEQSGIGEVTFSLDESGKLPDCLGAFQLDVIVSELTDNCKERGAKKITVTLGENTIRVEDDVRQKGAGEIVKKLNMIKGSEDKIDAKKWRKAMFKKTGGLGISEIVLDLLKATGGKLKYSVVEEDRIAAEITWVTPS